MIVPNVNLSVFLCAGERPFKCESCNYLAANQHEVTRHARQVHNGPKPLSCPYCDYKTADRSNYKKHVELHLNPRQFLCPLCKYAASKKCNLQYHIKSRHAGCDVAMDISKVKLRIKKAGPHGGEENAREHKLNNTSNTQEDFDMDRDSRDKGVEANPINLSIRRSSRPGTTQSAQSDASNKVQEKTCCPSDREKPAKVKEQDKRITTRQKFKRAHEKVRDEEIHPGSMTASKIIDGRAKTKIKKLQAEKATVETPSEEEDQAPRPDQQQSEHRRKVRPDKENQSSDSSRKKKKALHKSRRAGSQQSEKASKQPDHSQQKAGDLQQTREKKAAKEKAPKRKAAEALDLTKTSPDIPPKTRRMKGAAKLHPSPDEPGKTGQIGSTATMTTKQKKSKTVVVKDDHLSVHSHSSVIPGGPAPLHNSAGNSNKPKYSSAKKEDIPTPLRVEEPRESGDGSPTPAIPGKSQQCLDTSQKPMNPSSPKSLEPVAEPTEADHSPSPKKVDSSLRQDTSGVSSPPTLALPVEQSKPSDPEDDEGIHSSHEGGSDISDSASEGSEDSGLNSNGTGSGKLANDPETPTEELPMPTELKSHLCIFCDRSFPLEAAYRRHLHRHLLNVYYMDNTGGRGPEMAGRGHSSDQQPGQASEVHLDQ